MRGKSLTNKDIDPKRLNELINEKIDVIKSIENYSKSTILEFNEHAKTIKKIDDLIKEMKNVKSEKISKKEKIIKIIEINNKFRGSNSKPLKLNIKKLCDNGDNDNNNNNIITSFNLIFKNMNNLLNNYRSLCIKEMTEIFDNKTTNFTKRISKKSEIAQNFTNIRKNIIINGFIDSKKEKYLYMEINTNYFD